MSKLTCSFTKKLFVGRIPAFFCTSWVVTKSRRHLVSSGTITGTALFLFKKKRYRSNKTKWHILNNIAYLC
jgi:hypothetical protein